MKSPFKKKNVIDRRMRDVEARMAALHKEIRAVERQKERPLSSAYPVYREELRDEGLQPRGRDGEGMSGGGAEGASPVRDDRFANYLASSFQTMHPLKQERRIQRNKAIVMVVVVTVLLVWVVWLIRNVFFYS